MGSQPAEEVIPVAAVELMGALMERSLGETQRITNQLMEAHLAERDEARATIVAIRTTVAGLLEGRFQPSTSALYEALWPSRELVEYHRERLGQ